MQRRACERGDRREGALGWRESGHQELGAHWGSLGAGLAVCVFGVGNTNTTLSA